jgi:hypothetical protein
VSDHERMTMPKKRGETAGRAAAYHEAGHAVVAWLLDRSFRRVSIEEAEGEVGGALYRKWHNKFDPNHGDPKRARLQLEGAMMIALAGAEAERIHAGGRNNKGTGFDDELVTTLATFVIDERGEELPAFVNWLTIRTRNLLKLPQNWRAVEELAAALLERGEIGAAEAKGIIRRGARAGYEGLKAARE